MTKATTVGIDKDLGKDFGIGAVTAIAFIIAGSLFGIIGAIGIPSVPASIAGDIGRWIIIVLVASIFETVFFFEFVLDFFDNKLKNFGVNLPFIVASILTSIGFALFHFVAYSSSLSAAGGSFISAGVIAFGWCYLRRGTKSLLPLMVSHAILNAWIITKLFIVVG